MEHSNEEIVVCIEANRHHGVKLAYNRLWLFVDATYLIDIKSFYFFSLYIED